MKFYDARTESKLSVLADYQEFYKRLGEVELEYARNLDKVAERFQDRLRQKSQRWCVVCVGTLLALPVQETP